MDPENIVLVQETRTQTTIFEVINNRFAPSRYKQKLSHVYSMNEWINQSINSVSGMAASRKITGWKLTTEFISIIVVAIQN